MIKMRPVGRAAANTTGVLIKRGVWVRDRYACREDNMRT